MRQAITLLEGLSGDPNPGPALRERLALLNFRLGILLEKRGRPVDAADAYRQVLKWQPDHSPGCNALAWILATCAEPLVPPIPGIGTGGG